MDGRAARDARPLWVCPTCGRSFANRNQSHACGRYELDALFARSDPSVRATFDRLVDATESIGPLVVLPEKTRVAFHVRMSFAAFTRATTCTRSACAEGRR